MAPGNNIFAIDFDAVLSAVQESNGDLISRHNALIEAKDRMPENLSSKDDFQRAKRFAEQLKSHVALCRSTRLSDTKPLRELLKLVERFFKDMETDANSTQQSVTKALGDAALKIEQSTNPVQNQKPQTKSFLTDNSTGEVLGSASPAAQRGSNTFEGIDLTWEIDTIDPTTIDLEALREHFSTAVLMTAARKHLKASGPNSLTGATYKRVAVI